MPFAAGSAVRCAACDIELSGARAENAAKAARDHDGLLLCSACRDAATLQAECDRLREALDAIVDDLSVPTRPPAWAAHALQVAQQALTGEGE